MKSRISSPGGGGTLKEASGTTTDAYVEVFTHLKAAGLIGAGTIKNTHATNTMTVKETAIDIWGTTGTLETDVAPSDDYLLECQVNIGSGKAPYNSYKVEVKAKSAGNQATYELKFASNA